MGNSASEALRSPRTSHPSLSIRLEEMGGPEAVLEWLIEGENPGLVRDFIGQGVRNGSFSHPEMFRLIYEGIVPFADAECIVLTLGLETIGEVIRGRIHRRVSPCLPPAILTLFLMVPILDETRDKKWVAAASGLLGFTLLPDRVQKKFRSGSA